MKWAGFDNFAAIFKNFSFRKSDLGITLKNTVFYTLATVPLTILFSLVFALLLNKAVKAASVFRFIFFFPYVASIVAVCTCWNYLLMKYGVVNSFLNSIGFTMTKSWTQSENPCNVGINHRSRLALRRVLHGTLHCRAAKYTG